MSDKDDGLDPNNTAGFSQLSDRIDPDAGKGKKGKKAPAPIGKAIGGLVGIGLAATLLGYGLSGMREEQEKPLDTAEVEPWQGRGDGYTTMTSPGAAQAATAPFSSTPDLTPAAAQPSLTESTTDFALDPIFLRLSGLTALLMKSTPLRA